MEIRNFSIIAHIDHGKSTLADRFIEFVGQESTHKGVLTQVLDDMEIEQERGITIKLKAIRLNYKDKNGKIIQLNLIDTPGHVDFGYEVSRSLVACEGALLLVDATQGVQAQTLVNLEKARAEGLKIIPVINKIDLPSARLEESALGLIDLGFDENDIVYTSGKTGEGIDTLIKKIIEVIPAPTLYSSTYGDDPVALVFDSVFDDYRGVIAFVRMLNGKITKEDTIKLLASSAKSKVVELGFLSPTEVKVNNLSAGEVGFIATGIKDLADVRVGDTLTVSERQPVPIAGYKRPTPVVFLSIYPEDSSKYLELRESMERLSLNDSAFTFEPESIGSIGKGFRCGFLGLLHAEITRDRLEREFGINVITTTPSVKYLLTTTSGSEIEIKSASEYPNVSYIKEVKEPWASLDIYTTSIYMSEIMDFCKERRAVFLRIDYMENSRLKIKYEIPLIELIIDFYDKLKSMSSGYASINYNVIEYRLSKVVRLDIIVAGDEIAPLAQLVQKDSAHKEGKRIVKKLRELIPRQNFKVSLQAAIGGKFIAREDITPVRKDVTGYLYGGDVTRKNKLLEKQKKGKKRMKRFGKVSIPQDVFWKVMER